MKKILVILFGLFCSFAHAQKGSRAYLANFAEDFISIIDKETRIKIADVKTETVGNRNND